MIAGVGDISDCESYGKKMLASTNQQAVNMTSSQASLHSASSLPPDIHPFFKVPIDSVSNVSKQSFREKFSKIS